MSQVQSIPVVSGAPMTDVLDLHLRKRLRGTCRDCASPALEDSNYCDKHDAMARARSRKWINRQRSKRAELGRCADGCGRKVDRRRRQDGSIALTRCPKCKKKRQADQKERREKRRVDGLGCGVDGSPDGKTGNWRPDYDPDTGAEWQRYRGKGRRGRLTYEEQLDEDDRDLAEVERLVRRGRIARQRLKDPAIRDLPMVQREEAKRLANEDICRASRMLDEQADKYG